ncbi:MAG TPA: glycine--tRNA ligase, partial [Tepidisphaeraceae bacterium]|nr:glycine--tRNA ligase [Tepidisphaeraceae bacterium]
GDPVDMVGLDSSIIQHPKTWEASGHTATFADLMQSCRQCKKLVRADHVPNMLSEAEWFQSLNEKVTRETNEKPDVETSVIASGWLKMRDAKKLAPGAFVLFEKNPDYASKLASLVQDVVVNKAKSVDVCPHCGGDLTDPRPFNLMMVSYNGVTQDPENLVYLRPETAQGIFLNYKNVLDTTRVKVPFGVAQVGKSFRNEVTPRNFIFRSREFEQMEMEFFCPPEDALKWYEFWKQERMKWWLSRGVKQENLIFRDHAQDELSHYSKATVDIEYKYPFTAPDFGELEGIAHRGSFDLTQHQTHSGQKLDYFDQELQLKLKESGASPEEVKLKSRYIPNVIEPASGLTRAVLVLLCEAYTVEARSGVEKFEYFRFKPQFAPIKAGIFPLVNKDGMPEIAQKLYMDLRGKFTCEYDPKQSIGKRYARMDEIGTPFSITIDTQSLSDQTVTVRERDSQAQVRINFSQVETYLREKLS